MFTNKQNTFCGFWPMTKENTYFGYKITENCYLWYKTKTTVLKKLKGTKKQFHRATLVNGKMYINRTYLTMMRW